MNEKSLRFFTPQGRGEYLKIIEDAYIKGEKIDEKRINKILFNDNFTDTDISCQLDVDKKFKNKFELVEYLGKKLFIIDKDQWHERIFSNWGLMEWITALYHKQFTRPDNKRKNEHYVTPATFVVLKTGLTKIDSKQNFGSVTTLGSRHGILYFLYYYSLYKNKLKFILGDPLSRRGDIAEQFFAGGDDRLSLNLLSFIDKLASSYPSLDWDEQVRKIGLKRDHKFGSRFIVQYQTQIRLRYHPELMNSEEFENKIISLSDQWQSMNN